MSLPDIVVERLHGAGPHLVGVGGPVAVGKTTIAGELMQALRAAGRTAFTLSTDAFLLDNTTLGARRLTHRKGFPETYDVDAMDAALRGLRLGEVAVRVPVYSHATYDVVPGEFEILAEAEVVVVDGVMALNAPSREHLGVGVYVHAEEALVRRWFVERFLGLVASARADPTSFYAGFTEMTRGEVCEIAEGTWDAINGPNLHEHISATREGADVVVHKGPNHEVVEVEVR